MPSNYYDRRPVEQVAATRFFWENVLYKFQAVVSPLVIQELEDNPHQETRDKTLKLIDKFQVLQEDEEVQELGSEYISQEIIPHAATDDALHIAFATVHQVDFLITWNMKHIAGAEQRARIMRFNQSQGMSVPIIATPEELNKTYYED